MKRHLTSYIKHATPQRYEEKQFVMYLRNKSELKIFQVN